MEYGTQESKTGYTKYLNLCYSHKKRKDRLETRPALLVFSLELEISWISCTEHALKQREMITYVRHCLVKVTLRLF